MDKIGVSTCGDPFDESFFIDLGKNGIGYTEVSYTYDRDFASLITHVICGNMATGKAKCGQMSMV